MHRARREIDRQTGRPNRRSQDSAGLNRGDQWRRLEQWPGVRRAGLPRLSGGAGAGPAAPHSGAALIKYG
jgi:hypothetical protein